MTLFEGFIVDHWIPESGQSIRLTMIHCKKCGAKAPRETKYMVEVCTEIRCPTCGNHAVRSSEVNPA